MSVSRGYAPEIYHLKEALSWHIWRGDLWQVAYLLRASVQHLEYETITILHRQDGCECHIGASMYQFHRYLEYGNVLSCS